MKPTMEYVLAVRKSFIDNSTKTFWITKTSLRYEISNNLIGAWKPIYFK
jgi:hypothetical protein